MKIRLAFLSITLALFSQSNLQIVANPREPFALEISEIGGSRLTEAMIEIPTTAITQIKFFVKNPYAESIDYGQVFTKINGEAATTAQNSGADRNGKIITVSLENPRFRLRPGKNIVEIIARDKKKNEYYASYVLMSGGNSADYTAPSSGATIEYAPAAAGKDRQPPSLSITEPDRPLLFSGKPFVVKVSGITADDSGSPPSVSVNGLRATLSPATSGRGLQTKSNPDSLPVRLGAVRFEKSVEITSATRSVTVEASDSAGNTTRAVIPVFRSEAVISPQFSGQKYALIVGVSRYRFQENGLNNLRYADADARAVAEFLRRPEGGSFPSSNIALLENEEATLSSVRGAIKELLPRVGPNDLVFIFLAGHGTPDPFAPKNLYFVMHDTRVDNLQSTALPMTELKEALEIRKQIRRSVVFVDTCHSAGLSGGKMTQSRGLENNLISFYASKLYSETGSAVFTSSDINELSEEGTEWGGGHGIFTWALLEGLRGRADRDGDKFITAGELFTYIRARVSEATSRRQNPQAILGLNASLKLAFVNRVASSTIGKRYVGP